MPAAAVCCRNVRRVDCDSLAGVMVCASRVGGGNGGMLGYAVGQRSAMWELAAGASQYVVRLEAERQAFRAMVCDGPPVFI